MEKASKCLLEVDRNVSDLSRVASVLAGAVLIFKSFNGNKKTVKALSGGYLLYRGITGYCPLSEKLKAGNEDALIIQVSQTVNKARSEVYSYWRNLSNLPLFMKHLASVEETSGRRSTWKALVPGHIGTIVWDAEIIEDKENELICWHSLQHAEVENSGIVAFKDAGKFGTEVHVTLSYKAPAGKIGATIAKLFNPIFSIMVQEDIKNFRRYIETGEISTTDGQPTGK